MKINKILMGGIAAAVTFFFLGWIIWGMLLTDFMQSNYDQSLMKAEEDMIWWAMIVSNLVSGFLLAMILGWAGARRFSEGIKIGAITGLSIALAVDLSFYSMSDMFFSFTPVIADAVISAVLWAVAGMAVVWVFNLGKKKT